MDGSQTLEISEEDDDDEEVDLFEDNEGSIGEDDDEFESQLMKFQDMLDQPMVTKAKLKPNVSGSWIGELKQKLESKSGTKDLERSSPLKMKY